MTAQTLPCTFDGFHIQANQNEKKILKSNIESETYEGIDNIRNKIKDINVKKRDEKRKLNINLESTKKEEEEIWKLNTRLKAFEIKQYKEKMKDSYNFIEFIDLPGISDNIMNWKNNDYIHNKEIIKQFEANNTDFKKFQFYDLIRMLEIDIIIVLLDITKIHEIHIFLQYFEQNIFKGEKRAELKKIIQDKNIIFLVNKSDGDGKNIPKKAEKLEEITKLIFKVFHDNQDENEQKDYETFKKDYPINLVSGLQAIQSVFLTYKEKEDEEYKLTQSKTEKDKIKCILNAKMNERELNEKYSPESQFDQFLEKINEKILSVFEKKIQNEINEIIKRLQTSKSKYDRNDFLNLNMQISYNQICQLASLVEKFVYDEIEKLLNKIKKYLERRMDENIKIEKSFGEIIQTIEYFIDETNKDINKRYNQYIIDILDLFKKTKETEHKQQYIREILEFQLLKIIRNQKFSSEQILYSFLPENSNYLKYWLLNKILFTNFENTWNSFMQNLDKNLKIIEKKLKSDFMRNFFGIFSDNDKSTGNEVFSDTDNSSGIHQIILNFIKKE